MTKSFVKNVIIITNKRKTASFDAFCLNLFFILLVIIVIR